MPRSLAFCLVARKKYENSERLCAFFERSRMDNLCKLLKHKEK